MTTVGVCGFGRCGSTMVMAMLEAGGAQIAPNTTPGSWEANVDLTPEWIGAGAGTVMKLLDYAQRAELPVIGDWAFVWVDRDPGEQAASTMKFLNSVGVISPDRTAFWHQRKAEMLARSYGSDRAVILGKLRATGPVTVLQYERILASPAKGAKALSKVWPGLDRQAAAAVVHDRDGTNRPDLAFEISVMS